MALARMNALAHAVCLADFICEQRDVLVGGGAVVVRAESHALFVKS